MPKLRMFYTKSILFVVILMVFVFAGCNNNQNANMNPASGLSPSEGGVLNLASYPPDTLNPLTTGYLCMKDYLYLAYESLFIVNEDLSVTGVLAADYKSDKNNTVYTVSLKKGVRFHDGSAFTSDDVVSTFEYLQTYDTNYSHCMENVKSYKASGNYEVQITLNSPVSDFVANLDFPILPSGLKSDSFSASSSSFVINGTGRYKYKKTNPYESIILEKNPSWHSDAKVYIPKVCIRFVEGRDAIAYAFDAGETDMVTTDYGRWGEFPYSIKHNAYEVTTTDYIFIGLNTQNSAFSDVELRKKLSNLVDRNYIVDSVLFSHAEKAFTPISSKAYFYRNDSNDEVKPETEKLTDEKLSTYILYNEESPVKESVANYLKTLLEEAGVKAELTKVPYDTYINKVQSGDYQIYIGQVSMKNDSNLRFMFSESPIIVNEPVSTVTNTGEGTEGTAEAPAEEAPVYSYTSSIRICNYTNPTLDDIIENINTAKNIDTAKVACNNLIVFYNENIPQIPLAHINDAVFVSKRIEGKVNVNLTSFFADIGNIYIPDKDSKK